MALMRHAPGERVPIAGTYALVHHYGEATGFSVKVEVGDRFQLVTASSDGPLWYVLVDVPEVAAEAA